MRKKTAEVWKSPELAKMYLTGIRGAIPMANEQIQVMMLLIKMMRREVRCFLDLGCGDGILAASILQMYPKSRGVLLDFADPMIDAAKQKLRDNSKNLDFITFDYANLKWVQLVSHRAPFDVVVSGFSIHHQPDNRKRCIYSEVYKLLRHGGMFINMEHVLPKSTWAHEVFDEVFVDSIHELKTEQGEKFTRSEVAREFYNRPDKEANVLAPVERQCEWLRKIGYQDVDCYFKFLELAVFSGRKK
ncbi:MAG TPA: class I SAM-dependent methyltransferase [Candidatus Acidoferrales bacterium]|nr:class I SAM-dependent methyltransferase [Candidatus Acidoferrales bacterium]